MGVLCLNEDLYSYKANSGNHSILTKLENQLFKEALKRTTLKSKYSIRKLYVNAYSLIYWVC